RDIENCDALLTLLEQGLLHELDGADVESLAWLTHDQHLWPALDLAGQDDFLLIAAGEIARLLVDALQAHVVRLDEACRMVARGGEVEQAMSRERRPAIVTQHDVGGDRIVEHEAGSLAVLRNIAKSMLVQPVGRRRLGDVAATDTDTARDRR